MWNCVCVSSNTIMCLKIPNGHQISTHTHTHIRFFLPVLTFLTSDLISGACVGHSLCPFVFQSRFCLHLKIVLAILLSSILTKCRTQLFQCSSTRMFPWKCLLTLRGDFRFKILRNDTDVFYYTQKTQHMWLIYWIIKLN